MLPLSSGWVEPGRSEVSPIALPCAAVIRRMRARFFSVMFGGSRAGEYQAGGAPATVLRGPIARGGERLRQIWRFRKQVGEEQERGSEAMQARAVKENLTEASPFVR